MHCAKLNFFNTNHKTNASIHYRVYEIVFYFSLMCSFSQAIEECNKMRREEKFLLDYKVQLQEEHMKLTERMKELHSVVFPRVMH